MSRKKLIKTPTPRKKANPLHSLAKFIVGKYVDKRKVDWPRDVKIAMKIAADYPEPEFWDQLPCRFPCASMAVMFTPKARDYLKSQWAKFKLVLPDKKEYKLEEGIVSENLPNVLVEKPRTLLDFCN